MANERTADEPARKAGVVPDMLAGVVAVVGFLVASPMSAQEVSVPYPALAPATQSELAAVVGRGVTVEAEPHRVVSFRASSESGREPEQSGSAFGAPSDNAPNDMKALGYLIGEWRVRSFTRDDSGEFVAQPETTSYRARYLYDGLGILAEFYGPSRDGFYGVHWITHDPSRGLVHSYFNARANRRLEFVGSFGDGTYDLIRPGGYGGGDFLYRETDSEITKSSFVKRIYQSTDDGASWEEGGYYFRFERVR